MPVKKNIDTISAQIKQTAMDCGRDPKKITLIAVSKRKPAPLIEQAIDAGHQHFGENYIQEAMEKIDMIGKDRACWHFIGHLQSNKAKFAVPYFDLIHTVDTVKLAKEINKQASKIQKKQGILLQVNIAREDTKSGADAGQILDLAHKVSQFDHITIQGLMCMPPFFEDPEEARVYFHRLKTIARQIEAIGLPNTTMTHLSMGMSNDFKVAIEEGSTMVRVGTAIFGSRD